MNTLLPAGTRFADYANCHNYICHPSWPGLHDNQTWRSADPGPSCPVDGLYGNYGRTWAKKFPGYSEKELLTLPRVTTETGISTDSVITEEIQARLYLNLYLSQFKRGWKYTAVYLLKGRSNEPAHEAFAFYTLDYNPKKAAHYLHHFTTILADEGTVKQLSGKLNYSIPNQPATTHDLLLQKSNGHFMLILWGERFSSGGSDEVTVHTGKKYRNVKVYDPTVGTVAVRELRNTDSIDLSLTDHPLVIEIWN